MLSASVFEPLAEHATAALNLFDPTGASSYANRAIAAGLPMAYRATKNILGHPGQAAGRIGRGALVGAVTQPNALSPPQ